MLEVSKHERADPDERKIIALEFIAATSILLIVAFVLYMVFTFRPS
ncbi:MAG: hypothetical protein KIT09_00810 [Bryobacteraceae bacterium]|nr:hypothetical protein [Bryobacteraceae bacterium]